MVKLSGLGLWTFSATFFLFLRCTIYAQFNGGKDRSKYLPFPRGYPTKLHPCEQSSCYPATGNLLIGREAQLHASSTCGLTGQQRYCIVSHLEERKKCFWCDSRPTAKPNPQLNHNISNIVYRLYPGTRLKSWWQSENGKENVYIQLDLEAEFHFTHLIITFKTFRPAAMLIERSYDFGKTWQVYRYFAHNCTESFPGIPTGYPENLTDIVCESRYSSVAPSTEGEIIYRVLPPTLRIDNPYSEQVQNLLKMTNLRINFTKLHTLGDDLLDKREDIQEKYYYSIIDMIVRGSCSCYGHANRCLPLPGIDPKPDMVHGRCECTHNTKGRNCEKCEDFFNDLPWRPAIGKQTNGCQRCKCNNHTTSCHFDPAAYEDSGRTSGGVCDGCQHNTMGKHCDQCKPFFYQDPEKNLDDVDVCKPCDCDSRGSLDEGVCDSYTNEEDNFVAGRCRCRKNVQGRRCDSCKNGFWNFTVINPDGCEPCTCNTLGTVDNQGCNVDNGECTCKRFVTGRDCNQCLPEYWGLSEKSDGCQTCECDPGGSIDNFCDVITGQCKCREHMTGRTCSIPKQQYFTASLDYLLYEAELAKSSPNSQVVIREPYRDGRKDTWTGTGFIRVFDDSFIEFETNNIDKTTDYAIVINYEPELPNTWQEVLVTLIRPGPTDPNGECAQSPQTEIRTSDLPVNSNHAVVSPNVCLEAGTIYKIRFEFRRYDNVTPTKASILIDSINLIPSFEKIPWLNEHTPAGLERRTEFERYNCRDPSYFLNPDTVPEECKNAYSSISAYVFNGAFSCQCDPTGSVSKICDPYGGFCICKTNVVGRRCDRCAPGNYGFGPEGCKACDCNSIGSLDNFCNATTGQCKCRANTYGRECDQCRTGFWNFPTCTRCDCNGHADICDSKTGACINCKDNTKGQRCEDCIEGYYGDPKITIDIPCRPCPCPGLANSNHSYARSCALDPITKDVICDCQEGYSGLRCDVCSDNYYGNPEDQGGSCQLCDCNNNVDPLKPGNCDPHTGICRNCLYETTGDHCEVCKNGYYRTSENDVCRLCVCNPLGTNQTAGSCDGNTGQCPCLPNVIDSDCGRCEENFWKIASGEGCVPCDCDSYGSLQTQCNQYDGNCVCREGFGGRECNECKANFWGDPKTDECRKCECDIQGSKTMQCDMKTGACNCLPGIGGYNCDICARGYIGHSPQCNPCGECFDNWDLKLNEIKNKTEYLISRASNIKEVGARGAYTKEFDEMKSQLDEMEQLLNHTDKINIDDINEELRNLREQIDSIEKDNLSKLDNTLADTKEQLSVNKLLTDEIKKGIENLNSKINDLRKNATELQQENVQGALTLIQNAKTQVDGAAHKAEHTEKITADINRECQATEVLVNRSKISYEENLKRNQEELDKINLHLEELQTSFPKLNNLICDGNGNPCDAICGGAGCSTCGSSISCENGAKQQAEIALTFANNTENALKNKHALADDFIRNISQINSSESLVKAKIVFDAANKLFAASNNSAESLKKLKEAVEEFENQNSTKPDDIKKLAQELMDKKINISSPDEIKKLANDIKQKVDSITNTKDIINATRDDLTKVKALKEQAIEAKKNATQLSDNAKEVKEALENSTKAQENAEKAINKALNDTSTVDKLLDQIKLSATAAQNQTDETNENLKVLEGKLIELQQNITKNDNDAKRVKQEDASNMDKALKTQNKFEILKSNYSTTQTLLNNKTNTVSSLKAKADEVSKRAVFLVHTVTKTQEDISKLENTTAVDLSALERHIALLVERMKSYTNHIEERANYYRICT